MHTKLRQQKVSKHFGKKIEKVTTLEIRVPYITNTTLEM